MKTILFTLVVLLLAFANLNGQDGSLDLTFGTNGIVTTSIGNITDKAEAMCIQPDGKILVAGFSHNGVNNDFALVRYNTDGSLDLTFDTDGMITTAIGLSNEQAHAISLQPDGKILVAGFSDNGSNFDFAVARYNTDGSLDLSFDVDGIVTTKIESLSNDQAYGVIVQPDGKILVGGKSQANSGIMSYFTVVRYHTDGSLDLSFGTNGIVKTSTGSPFNEVNAISLQADGKILLAGYLNITTATDFTIIRYHTDGSLDLSFDSDGIVTTAIGPSTDYANTMNIQPDGKILVGGMSSNTTNGNGIFSLVRYNTDGSLDLSFDSDGKVTTAIGGSGDGANAMALQPNGKILLAGQHNTNSSSVFAVVRYNSDGSLDLSFGSNGKVTTTVDVNDYARAICLQPDGKILVAGNTRFGTNENFALVRYDNNITGINALENSISTMLIYPNPFHLITTIDFGSMMDNVELSVYNIHGQNIKTVSNISGTTIRLNREELASGLYVIKLTQNSKVIATDKIIVE